MWLLLSALALCWPHAGQGAMRALSPSTSRCALLRASAIILPRVCPDTRVSTGARVQGMAGWRIVAQHLAVLVVARLRHHPAAGVAKP